MMYQNPHIVQALDYSRFFLHEQNDVISKSKQRISFYWHCIPRFLTDFFSVNELLKKVNSKLTAQLLYSKGFIAELNEKFDTVKGSDLSTTISDLNKLIEINILLYESVKKIKSDDVRKNYTELNSTETILEECLENLYDLLRLLKRANKVVPGEPSELAIGVARHSANSLQKVIYGD